MLQENDLLVSVGGVPGARLFFTKDGSRFGRGFCGNRVVLSVLAKGGWKTRG